MRFKKLKIKNIRSYKELEIEFPKGSILLAGDIGAGKTSVLLALQFALFGLQPGQKGASILRQGEDNAYAQLELEIDGKTIILERTIKKSKKGAISQDSNTITIDNQTEELSTSEMKNRVITFLEYPKEFVKKSNLLYKFTVYTPQEEMKSIIQERPETRLDTLRHVFGIDRYKRIKENLQIFTQKIKESVKIKEVQVSELNQLKEKLAIENEKKIQLARETNNIKIEHQTLISQKQEAEQKLNSIKELIEEKTRLESEHTKNLATLEGKKNMAERMKREIALMQKQISEKIEFSEDRLQAVTKLLNKHKLNLDQSNTKFLEANSRISVLDSKKQDSHQLKEKVTSLDNCPTCFQQVSPEHKDKISKRTQFDIEEINRELERKIVEKDQLIKDIEKEKELIKGYELDKTKLQQDRIKFEHQKTIDTKIKSDAFILDRTLNEVKEFEITINALKTKLETFKQHEQTYAQYQTEFNNIDNLTRQKEIIMAEKNKELEILKIQIENLNQEILKKQNILGQIHHLRELQDWLQEKFLSIITLTEKNVMAKLRSEFSKIFSEWFSSLVSETISVRLDEDFTPIITNQDYEIDYDFLSGGERTAVALAYRLALNQVLNSLLSKIKTKDVVILDEPTDGFATEQIDKMRDIFEQLHAEQTILVSHEEKIEGFVDHVIRIKKDGTSSVE
jgi:exonuclease SbcC|tara:strand:+ start:74 stop:2116 length:2043 start_codon:yes stop_codon:yes gene_type:complete